MARPKRFELLTPRFVAKSTPLKLQENFANYIEMVTCDDNGLHRVCKPFRPVQASPAISPGQREIKSHRAATTTPTIATATATSTVVASGSHKGRQALRDTHRRGTLACAPEAQTTGISTARSSANSTTAFEATMWWPRISNARASRPGTGNRQDQDQTRARQSLVGLHKFKFNDTFCAGHRNNDTR
jgi:hypothetical protein